MENAQLFDLIGKELSGDINVQEKSTLKSWLEEDSENQKTYTQVRRIWDLSVRTDLKEPDVAPAWKKVQKKINDTEAGLIKELYPSDKKTGFNRLFIRYAAAAVLVIGIVTLIWQLKVADISIESNDVAGNVKEVLLPDGSKVWLNKNSELSYSRDFNETLREVTLEGEAFFEIKRDENKAFIISAGNSHVKVLGTSFNVRSIENEEEIIVTVATGKVSFSSGPKEVFLFPGEKGELNKTSGELVKTGNNDNNYLSWKNKNLQFKNEKLGTVLKKMEELYDVKFEMQDPAFADCHITGTFNAVERKEALNILSQSLNLQFKDQGNKILITGGPCR